MRAVKEKQMSKVSTTKTTAKAKADTKGKVVAKTKVKATSKSRQKKAISKPKPSAKQKIAAKSVGKVAVKPVNGSASGRKTTRGQRYMNQEQRNQFRTMLEEWREQLLTGANDAMSHIQIETKSYPDDADRASQEEGFSIELRTRDRERKLIRKIDHSLELIDKENYGYCTACGVEIGILRLRARPTATLCIDCKTMEESKEKHLFD